MNSEYFNRIVEEKPEEAREVIKDLRRLGYISREEEKKELHALDEQIAVTLETKGYWSSITSSGGLL